MGAENYSSTYRELDLHSGQVVEFEDAIYPAGTLRWKFVDRDGHPIAGVVCHLAPNDAQSIETIRDDVTYVDGTFAKRELYPGDYTGTATFPDGSTLSENFKIVAGETTEKITRRE